MPLQVFYNPGIMWVASGVLEWMADLIFSSLKNDPGRYEKMIAAAGAVPADERIAVL